MIESLWLSIIGLPAARESLDSPRALGSKSQVAPGARLDSTKNRRPMILSTEPQVKDPLKSSALDSSCCPTGRIDQDLSASHSSNKIFENGDLKIWRKAAPNFTFGEERQK